MSQPPSRVDEYVEAYRTRQETIQKLRIMGLDLAGIGRFLIHCNENTTKTSKGFRNRVGNQHEYLTITSWPTMSEFEELIQSLGLTNKKVDEAYKQLSDIEKQLVESIGRVDNDDPLLN